MGAIELASTTRGLSNSSDIDHIQLSQSPVAPGIDIPPVVPGLTPEVHVPLVVPPVVPSVVQSLPVQVPVVVSPVMEPAPVIPFSVVPWSALYSDNTTLPERTASINTSELDASWSGSGWAAIGQQYAHMGQQMGQQYSQEGQGWAQYGQHMGQECP